MLTSLKETNVEDTISLLYNILLKESQYDHNSILDTLLSSLYQGLQNNSKIEFVSNEQFAKRKGNQNNAYICEHFISLLLNKTLSWPNIQLMKNILEKIEITDDNSVLIASMLENMSTHMKRDIPSVKMLALEIMAVFLPHVIITSKINFVNSRLLLIILKHTKSYPEVRISALNALNSIIKCFGTKQIEIPQDYHYILMKIFKNLISPSERTLEVRAAALRCASNALPQIIANADLSEQFQNILLKEMMISPAVGHVYGQFLSLSLSDESQVPNLSFQRSSLDISTPVKRSLNFTSIFEFICLYFNKYNRIAHRESLSKCAVSFLTSLKFEMIKTHINVIFKCLSDLLIHPTLKVNKNVLIIEAKSCVSYILRAGIINKLSESQRFWFLENLLHYIELLLDKLSNDVKSIDDTSIIVSCFLVEVEYLMGIIEENIINLNVDIEKLVLKTILLLCNDKTLANSNTSSVWVAAGIVLKKYSSLNEQYDFELERIFDDTENKNIIIPLVWAFYCTKSNRSCNIKQFKISLEKFKDLFSQSEQSDVKHYWKISSWMILSSLTYNNDAPKLKLEKQSILKNTLQYIKTFWDSTFHSKPDISTLNYVTLEMIFALDALYNIIKVYDILNQDFIKFISDQLKTLITYLTEWKDPQTFNLMCSLLAPVLKVYDSIKDLFDSEDSILISKGLLKLLINFLINSKHNHHSDSLIQQFLPIEDDILETKPKEFEGYSPIATKCYADYHGSTYSFVQFLNYRSKYSTENHYENFLSLSTSEYALYKSITIYHHLFVRNTTHQNEIISFFDSHIKELDDSEQQNIVITNFLLVFHCVTSNLINNPQLNMSKVNLNLLMEKIVPFIQSPINIHRRLSSSIAANICYLDEEIHVITAKRLLISIQNIADDCSLMGIGLTLSKIHQIVGSRTRSYCNDTLHSLSSVLRKAIDLNHHELTRYALHCLFITLEAVGTSAISQTKHILKLTTEIMSKEFTHERRLLPQLSRITASVIQILGPELNTHTEYMEQIVYTLIISEIYGDIQVNNELLYLYNSSEHEKYTNGLVKGSFVSCFGVLSMIWQRLLLFTNRNYGIGMAKEKFIQQTARVFSININEDRHSEILSMKLNAIQSLKLVVQLQPDFFEDRIFIHYIFSLLNFLHPKSTLKNEIYSILSILEDSINPSKWITICCEYILSTSPLTLEYYSKSQKIPHYFKILIDHISLADNGLLASFVAKSTNNSIKKILKSNALDDIIQNIPLYIKICLKTLQSRTFSAICSGVELFCTITRTFKRLPQLDSEKIKQFLLLFTNVMKYNIAKENISSFKSFYCACYGYCQYVLSMLEYFPDLSIVTKITDPLFSHSKDTKSSTFFYWQIALSHLFKHSNYSFLNTYLQSNHLDAILKDSWINLLKDFAIYDKSIIGRDSSLIFPDVEFIKIGFIDILLSLTSQFVKDDPPNIQFCLSLILKSLSQSNKIKKNLKAMSQLFETISPSCIAPALLDYKNIVNEIFEACLGLFKRSGKDYNQKLLILNTSKRFILSILSVPEFNNHPDSDIYTNIACQFLQDIIEFEEVNFILFKPYSYMSTFMEIISISWQTLQPTKQRISSLLLWMFNLPILMNDYENIDNSFYRTLLKSIKRVQSKNRDSFLHCQLNTSLQIFKNVDKKLKDWYIGLLFTTLTSLKKDTGSVELHSIILSIFLENVNKNTLNSFYSFISNGLKSQYVPLNALSQSYLGVLAPRITTILLESLENGQVDPDLFLSIVNVLSLLQKIGKKDRSLNNMIIVLLLKLINFDVNSNKPYYKVHETSMKYLIKMSKELPDFKLCTDSLSQSERNKLDHILNLN